MTLVTACVEYLGCVECLDSLLPCPMACLSMTDLRFTSTRLCWRSRQTETSSAGMPPSSGWRGETRMGLRGRTRQPWHQTPRTRTTRGATPTSCGTVGTTRCPVHCYSSDGRASEPCRDCVTVSSSRYKHNREATKAQYTTVLCKRERVALQKHGPNRLSYVKALCKLSAGPQSVLHLIVRESQGQDGRRRGGSKSSRALREREWWQAFKHSLIVRWLMHHASYSYQLSDMLSNALPLSYYPSSTIHRLRLCCG